MRGLLVLPSGVQGGFRVWISSRRTTQARSNRTADNRIVRCDKEGKFFASVLPGETYRVSVQDSRWVSSVWEGVIAKKDGTANKPRLTLSPGIPVKINCTVGEDASPLASKRIDLYSRKTRQRWETKTDGDGVAMACMAAELIEVRVSDRIYQDSKELSVVEGEPNVIKFHFERVEKDPETNK